MTVHNIFARCLQIPFAYLLLGSKLLQLCQYCATKEAANAICRLLILSSLSYVMRLKLSLREVDSVTIPEKVKVTNQITVMHLLTFHRHRHYGCIGMLNTNIRARCQSTHYQHVCRPSTNKSTCQLMLRWSGICYLYPSVICTRLFQLSSL